MIRWGSRLLLAFNIVFLVILTVKFGWHGLSEPTGEWSYPDLVVILLTGVAVLLAVATVFIAGMAIWGYAAIREAAQAKAEEIANTVATDVARTVATDVAQTVAMREAISAREITGADGAPTSDALSEALKSGSAAKKTAPRRKAASVGKGGRGGNQSQ